MKFSQKPMSSSMNFDTSNAIFDRYPKSNIWNSDLKKCLPPTPLVQSSILSKMPVDTTAKLSNNYTQNVVPKRKTPTKLDEQSKALMSKAGSAKGYGFDKMKNPTWPTKKRDQGYQKNVGVADKLKCEPKVVLEETEAFHGLGKDRSKKPAKTLSLKNGKVQGAYNTNRRNKNHMRVKYQTESGDKGTGGVDTAGKTSMKMVYTEQSQGGGQGGKKVVRSSDFSRQCDPDTIHERLNGDPEDKGGFLGDKYRLLKRNCQHEAVGMIEESVDSKKKKDEKAKKDPKIDLPYQGDHKIDMGKQWSSLFGKHDWNSRDDDEYLGKI